MKLQIAIQLVVVVVLNLALYSRAQPSSTWSSTGSMNVPRAYHQSVVLNDGRVFISGGVRYILDIGSVYLSSCEIYDPTLGQWTLTSSLAIRRYFHTMTVLQNGKVLVTGGAYSSGNRFYHLNDCQLYDSSNEQWTTVSSMNVQRAGHTATLLQSGKVLVTGGLYHDGSNDIYLRSCELYDPNTNKWSITDSMFVPRKDHSASQLPDGRVLVVSGQYAITYPNIVYLNSCEVFNPSVGQWFLTDSIDVPQVGNASVVLSDGRVFISGGHYALKSCEIFLPISMSWSLTDSMTVGRDSHTATLLPNGKVLVVGGQGVGTGCEVFDPFIESFTDIDTITYDISNHSAILLGNGKVLIAGGYSYSGGGYQATCLLYDYTVTSTENETGIQAVFANALTAYPNPFNSKMSIRFMIETGGIVQVRIFDVLGREVKTILDEFRNEGSHLAHWSGIDENRRTLSSGVYLCTLSLEGKLVGTTRLIILK